MDRHPEVAAMAKRFAADFLRGAWKLPGGDALVASVLRGEGVHRVAALLEISVEEAARLVAEVAVNDG